ncbi:hypothetical protein [Legionella hackeliae]|uniref:Uncharacterized protein n=1 Tax=Legionella hackeliae TaxID=449 RepID=A0A0A8UW88_LEGHA|nr:hypothetical protein [Legionella hackeliae]KTD09892.1 hypothetical protein Lhac_2260 [Legionella hackeliae]CEK11806.1 protein of unknown function [Legionella hackeliae]STX48576.1 Uncharacterised protein [Legionella hackeliae]
MKKSSSNSSKKQTKENLKKNNLKNISGGKFYIPDVQPDPDEIRRILDERLKR